MDKQEQNIKEIGETRTQPQRDEAKRSEQRGEHETRTEAGWRRMET
jgi:hypothetical protein